MFWELLAESIIVQSLVTLLVVSTACYTWITTGTVDETLLQIVGIVVGFWMGTKAQHTAETIAKQKK